ncbi:MAG: hypothetical protein MZV64_42270 [Ignavibacteriales bacterium]|nr:hypothetical protein [Ignavibacteriales bacterium]
MRGRVARRARTRCRRASGRRARARSMRADVGVAHRLERSAGPAPAPSGCDHARARRRWRA